MNKTEKKTVYYMISRYCKDHHTVEGDHQLCLECQKLAGYANMRLERCKFGNEKPVCKKCPVHCYKPDMKQQISLIMRYSGPRLLLSHPFLALAHLWQTIFR